MDGRIIALAAAALLVLGPEATALASPARTAPHISAFPPAGHPGDAIYVSGSGFPATRQLFLTMTCPAVRAHANPPAVRTDNAGRFVASQITAPTPGSARAASCRIYASQAPRSGGGAPSVAYRLVPWGKPLPYCATHICLHVTASLVRLRSGTQGTVVIGGWPGARVTVTIAAPGAQPIVRQTRLDWRGAGAVRARVSLGLKRGVARRATVVARLGRVRGVATAQFVIVPGGR